MEQNKIWVGILLVAILVGGYWIADHFTSKTEQIAKEEIIKEVVKEVIIKKPSCPDTTDSFNELKNAGQIVTLAKDLNSYGGSDGFFVNRKFTVVKSAGSGSQIACGYLYINMHASKGRLLDLKWEHPFIKPGQFGGHIVTDESIIPITNGEAGELLYNLSKISYWESNGEKERRVADWAALFNVSDRIEFEIALNTTDYTGVLNEVAIAYKCWSPETGQVTQDCKLSVKN